MSQDVSVPSKTGLKNAARLDGVKVGGSCRLKVKPHFSEKTREMRHPEVFVL